MKLTNLTSLDTNENNVNSGGFIHINKIHNLTYFNLNALYSTIDTPELDNRVKSGKLKIYWYYFQNHFIFMMYILSGRKLKGVQVNSWNEWYLYFDKNCVTHVR